jgi:hypothetical protein
MSLRAPFGVAICSKDTGRPSGAQARRGVVQSGFVKPSVALEDRRLVIRYGTEMTEDDLTEYLAELDAALAKCSTCVAIVHVPANVKATANRRKRQGDWLKSRSQVLQKKVVAAVFVMGGIMQRGILTAILWLMGGDFPVPYQIVSTSTEAEAWVQAQLERIRAR